MASSTYKCILCIAKCKLRWPPFYVVHFNDKPLLTLRVEK